MSDQPPLPTVWRSANWLYALFAVWLFVGVALFQWFPESIRSVWMKESGPIETFSALGYFICASVAVGWLGRKLLRQWYLVVVLLLMGMRELDFHSRFTTMGVFKRRFYISDAVPLGERVLVAAILIALAVGILLALRREAPSILGSLRQRSPVVIGVIWGLALAVVSKGVDGLERHLSRLGLTAPPRLLEVAGHAEEIMELGIPVMFMTAMLAYIFMSIGAQQVASRAGVMDGPSATEASDHSASAEAGAGPA